MQVPAFFLSNSNDRFFSDSNSFIAGDRNLLNHTTAIQSFLAYQQDKLLIDFSQIEKTTLLTENPIGK